MASTIEVARLVTSLIADARQFSKGLSDSVGEAKQFASDVGEQFKSVGDEAKSGFDVIGSAISGVATGGVTLLVGALATLGTGLAAISTAGLKWAAEFGDAMKMVEAQTGIAGEQLDSFRGIAQDVYQMGLGESFADVAQAMTQVHQVTDVTEEALEDMTADAITMAEVFDVEVGESVRAVDQAMIAFGEEGTAVFDMMTATMQQTGDPMDDLADTINEYSTNFAEAGFSAEQMFGVLNAGLEAGAWNFDKVGDTVREFFIRLEDGSDTTAKALNELFSAPGDEVRQLTAEMGFLEAQIRYNEEALEDTEAALDDANTAWGAAQEVVKDLESALSEARAELNELSRPNLAGMEEFDDRIFGLEQSIKQARLAMLDMEEDTPEFETAKEQLDGLNKELEKTRLAQDIQYDAQFRALEEAAAAGTEEIVTFDQAMADIVAKKGEIDGLEGSLWNAQQAEAAAAVEAERLQAAYDATAIELTTNKDKLEAVKTALENADTPAKQFLDDLAAGAITGPEAMSEIIQALKEVEDPIERNQIGVALFGSMWEDMGESVVLAMDPATASLEGFEGATGRAGEAAQQGLGSAWERLTRTIKVSVGEGFAPVLTMLVENITPAFEHFAEWMRGDGQAVFERFGKLLTDNLAPALEQLGPFIAEKVIPGLEKFADWLINVGIPAIQDLINWLTEKGIPGFKNFIQSLERTGSTVGKIAKAIAAPFRLVFKTISSVLKKIEKIFHRLFGNSVLLDTAYKFGQKLVRTVVSFLAGVISEVIQFGTDLIDEFIEFLGDTLSEVIEFGQDLISEFIEFLGDTLNEVIQFGRDLISEFIEFLGDTLNRVIEFGSDLINEFIEFLNDTLSEVIEFGQDLISEFVEFLSDTLSEVIEFGQDLISEFIEFLGDTLNEVIQFGSDLINEFTSFLSDVLSDVVQFGQDLISEFVSFLENILSDVIQFGSDLIDEFTSFLGNVIDDVVQWGQDLISEFTDALSGVIDEVIQFGSDLLNQFITALSGIINEIISWGTELYNTFRDVLLQLAQVPAEISETLSQIGADIINWVIVGIQAVGDFVSRVRDQLVIWFEDLKQGIVSSFLAAQDVGTELIDKIMTGIQSVTTFVSDLKDKLVDWLGALADNVGGVANGIISEAKRIGGLIVDWFVDGIKGVGDFATRIKDWIIEQLEKILGIHSITIPQMARNIGADTAQSLLDGFTSQDSVARNMKNALSGWITSASGMEFDMGINVRGVGGVAGVVPAMAGAAAATGNFYTTINTPMDEEEFYYRVAETLRQMG
jgi:phage-related minor tail protein